MFPWCYLLPLAPSLPHFFECDGYCAYPSKAIYGRLLGRLQQFTIRKRFDLAGYYLKPHQPHSLLFFVTDCDARSVNLSNRHNHKPDNAASLGTCQKTMSSMRRKQARSRIGMECAKWPDGPWISV